MDYYLSRNTDTVFDSVMCCGAGAGVKGLRTLFKNELQYDIMILNDMENCTLPEFDKGEGLFLYTAVLAPQVSGVNLMEKISKKQGERRGEFKKCSFCLHSWCAWWSCAGWCWYWMQNVSGACTGSAE